MLILCHSIFLKIDIKDNNINQQYIEYLQISYIIFEVI